MERDPGRNAGSITSLTRELRGLKEEIDQELIDKARVEWTEKGEKCTKYFFSYTGL